MRSTVVRFRLNCHAPALETDWHYLPCESSWFACLCGFLNYRQFSSRVLLLRLPSTSRKVWLDWFAFRKKKPKRIRWGNEERNAPQVEKQLNRCMPEWKLYESHWYDVRSGTVAMRCVGLAAGRWLAWFISGGIGKWVGFQYQIELNKTKQEGIKKK